MVGERGYLAAALAAVALFTMASLGTTAYIAKGGRLGPVWVSSYNASLQGFHLEEEYVFHLDEGRHMLYRRWDAPSTWRVKAPREAPMWGSVGSGVPRERSAMCTTPIGGST